VWGCPQVTRLCGAVEEVHGQREELAGGRDRITTEQFWDRHPVLEDGLRIDGYELGDAYQLLNEICAASASASVLVAAVRLKWRDAGRPVKV